MAVKSFPSDTCLKRGAENQAVQARVYHEQKAQTLGLDTVSGSPPFILIELGERVQAIHSELEKRKIIVADAKSWNLPHHLRVSYGCEEENQAFFRELKKIL